MTKSGQIIIPYGDAPDAPPIGKVALYSKTNNELYYKTDDGSEYLIISSSGIGMDHGQLLGLLDDDHTQYHTNARGDVRYYTKGQINNIITTISGKLDDHNELNDLDFESSGHTGFASATMLANTSGVLQYNIDHIDGGSFI